MIGYTDIGADDSPLAAATSSARRDELAAGVIICKKSAAGDGGWTREEARVWAVLSDLL